MGVVEMSACPSNSCTARRSAPWFSRCVSSAWRSVCGEIGLRMPAASAYFLTRFQNIWRDIAAARTVTNSASLRRPSSSSDRALPRPSPERPQPLLRALAHHADDAVGQAQVDELELDQLADAQAARVHQLQH